MDRRKHPLPSNPFLPARPAAAAPPAPSVTPQRVLNRLPQKASYQALPRPPAPHYVPPRPSGQPQVNVQAQGQYYGYQSTAQVYHAPQFPQPGAAGYPAYSAYPTPIAQPYAQPHIATMNMSGGYPSFGFTPVPVFKPTATPEGYSYSETYQPQSATAGPQGPYAKRQKTQGNGLPPPPSNGPPIPVASSSTPSVKAWRNCSQPGCKFVGSGEEVEIHEGDRHLIFPKGHKVERSEEEERFAQRQKGGPPPMIQGTGIMLQTEEDIAKWIAERKARFPTAKRVADKEEEHRAAVERGEIPHRSRGLGSGRGRNDPAAAAEEWGRPVEDRPASSRSDKGRGRGRGRGRDGRGGGSGRWEERERARAVSLKPIETTVNDQLPTPTTPAPHDLMPPPPAPPVTSAPSALHGVGGYGSSASDDDSSSESSSDSDSDSDDSSAESGANEKGGDPVGAAEREAVESEPKREEEDKRPLCRFFARTGKCKHGDKCKYSHRRAQGQGEEQEPKAVTTSEPTAPRPKQPPTKKPNAFQRPSMLGALLANPIQNTLSQLSQTIRFLVANDMLENVELVPGQAEEEERKRQMIVELEPTT